MKRTLKIAASLAVALLVTTAFASGQDKKEQKQVKVVIADKDGKKVVLDTVLYSVSKADTIRLKDGKVFFVGKPGDNEVSFTSESGKDGNMIVTVVSDSKDGKKVEKEIHVTAGDPGMVMQGGDGEKVMIIRSGDDVHGAEGGNVMSWSSAGSGEKGNFFYVTKDKNDLKDGEKRYNIEVRTDESGNEMEKTNYVIAKDGMVITIEGGNEEKVRDLAAVIEAKLGVAKDDKSSKTQPAKDENKKTTKK